jgi:hypothetical protein
MYPVLRRGKKGVAVCALPVPTPAKGKMAAPTKESIDWSRPYFGLVTFDPHTKAQEMCIYLDAMFMLALSSTDSHAVEFVDPGSGSTFVLRFHDPEQLAQFCLVQGCAFTSRLNCYI